MLPISLPSTEITERSAKPRVAKKAVVPEQRSSDLKLAATCSRFYLASLTLRSGKNLSGEMNITLVFVEKATTALTEQLDEVGV